VRDTSGLKWSLIAERWLRLVSTAVGDDQCVLHDCLDDVISMSATRDWRNSPKGEGGEPEDHRESIAILAVPPRVGFLGSSSAKNRLPLADFFLLLGKSSRARNSPDWLIVSIRSTVLRL